MNGWTALLVATAALAPGCKKDRSPEPEPEPRLELQGHRGARGLAPENTLTGFRTALAVGVDTLEIDVHLTGDGELVVHHDEWLSPELARGPDGEWVKKRAHRLGDMTLAQIRRFDVGRYRPGSPTHRRFPRARPAAGPERPPSLAEVIALGRGTGVGYNIETKLHPEHDDGVATELADAVIAAIRSADLAGRANVQSFDWRTLARVREQAPEIATACLTNRGARHDTIARGRPGPSPWTAGLDVDAHGGSVPELVRAAGCAIWSPNYFSLDRGEVIEAHRLGLRVVTWTVNEPEHIAGAIALGVDGVITDHPDRAREVMASRGLPLPEPRNPRP